MKMNERFENILFHLRPACMEHYGDRLVSVEKGLESRLSTIADAGGLLSHQ